MFFRTLLLTCLLFPFISSASPKISSDSASSLIKAYSLAANPNLAPGFQVLVIEYTVKDLYDSMGVQIFKADFYSQSGTFFNSGMYTYHNGTVRPFVDSFGGWGLMSGFVLKRTFYYSYMWGSGIQRSQIGCFSVNSDSLAFLESGGYTTIDLFVSNCSGDSICVVTGYYQSFNLWTLVKDNKWRVVIVNGTRLALIDSTGKEVPPEIPLYTRGDIKVRKLNVPDHLSSIAGNLMVNVKGQTGRNFKNSSIIINKKRSLVIIDSKTRPIN
jgi:hypothetical protein